MMMFLDVGLSASLTAAFAGWESCGCSGEPVKRSRDGHDEDKAGTHGLLCSCVSVPKKRILMPPDLQPNLSLYLLQDSI